MTINDVDDLLTSQLDIARQSLEEKDKRIEDLQRRVELLEEMLNRASAQRFGPQPQPLPALKTAPRRWSVR